MKKSIIEPPGNPHRVRSGPYAEVGPLDCSDVARVSTASKVKRPSGAAGVEMSAKFWRLLSDSDRIPEGQLWSWREELALRDMCHGNALAASFDKLKGKAGWVE